MSILRIVILAALCGIAMGQYGPKMTIDLDKISTSNKENDYIGNFAASVTHKSPRNTGSLVVRVKRELPDNFMIRFSTRVADKELPPVEITLCKAIVEESIGKPTVAQGDNPFPKSCPIEAGTYTISKYIVDAGKLPSSLPPGKFSAMLQLYIPDKEPIGTMVVEGKINTS